MVFVANDAVFRVDLRAGQPRSSAARSPGTSPTRARRSRCARARGSSTRSPTRRPRRGRPRPNGGGPSLELSTPTADNSLAGNWSANPADHGHARAREQRAGDPGHRQPDHGDHRTGRGRERLRADDGHRDGGGRHRRGVGRAEGRRDAGRRRHLRAVRFTWNATATRAAHVADRRHRRRGQDRLSTIVNVTVPVDSHGSDHGDHRAHRGSPGLRAPRTVTATASDNHRRHVGRVAGRRDGRRPPTPPRRTPSRGTPPRSVPHTLQTVATDAAGNTGVVDRRQRHGAPRHHPPGRPGHADRVERRPDGLTLSWTAATDDRASPATRSCATARCCRARSPA